MAREKLSTWRTSPPDFFLLVLLSFLHPVAEVAAVFTITAGKRCDFPWTQAKCAHYFISYYRLGVAGCKGQASYDLSD